MQYMCSMLLINFLFFGLFLSYGVQTLFTLSGSCTTRQQTSPNNNTGPQAT